MLHRKIWKPGGSLSARRAWIEMFLRLSLCPLCWVALRKESVDRNFASSEEVFFQAVALRKESVDRNSSCIPNRRLKKVALRKESVDRNKSNCFSKSQLARVALRKESVDRNWCVCETVRRGCWSLSARRAWIEILKPCEVSLILLVALRKESVDRNTGF